MKLPQGLVRVRSAAAAGIGAAIAVVEPIRQRAMRFVYEVWARSRIRGSVEPGTQFIGLTTVEGTGNIHVGRGTRIGRRAFLETQGSGRIDIGRNAVINDGAVIVAYDHVTIGDFALVGEYVSIRDANHGMAEGTPMRKQPHTAAPIRIGRDAWLGRGVCVLGGVEVGEGAVVGANSVVTKGVPSYGIAVGAPARVIGSRRETTEIKQTART